MTDRRQRKHERCSLFITSKDRTNAGSPDTGRFGVGMFFPAKGDSVSQSIVDQIEKAVMAKKLLPGDRLPSERELQETFKAGRGSVREALGVLKQKGLVEIRKGVKGGGYIRQLGVDQVSESLAFLFRHRAIPTEHLNEFRESIERTVASLAAVRGGKADLADLSRLIDELEEECAAESPEMDRLAALDKKLYLLLAHMTGNPVFEWVVKAVQLTFGPYDALLYHDAELRRETISCWREFAQALEKREPVRASSVVSYHFVRFNRFLSLNNLSEKPPGDLELGLKGSKPLHKPGSQGSAVRRPRGG